MAASALRPIGNVSPCRLRSHWSATTNGFGAHVRWISTRRRETVRRYSRPITAPESSPNRSESKSPKSPCPSGRHEDGSPETSLYRGIRSVVGSATSVKSGCARLMSRSGPAPVPAPGSLAVTGRYHRRWSGVRRHANRRGQHRDRQAPRHLTWCPLCESLNCSPRRARSSGG